ncbi:family 43 glycosylhydrolase [Carboxylicivirga mesophila]|uniref:Family 43 glycosylhydrolase n=1 Tax=Carboxylicivirga mesophila TaxID=1166478 RepID=A0ABS5KAB9_9BACT|nr:family 43 glycosylhydrolase [Carboxylicivirga mesophila]MBS2211308.1 family 43 glycosylhydrolase [Carboxylicivirga mesophila]
MKMSLIISLLFVFSSAITAVIKPDTIIVYKTVDDVDLSLHVFFPDGHTSHDSKPAIVFFHGGGFKSGSPEHFYGQCQYLASRGMVAISAQYRTEKANGTSPIECIKDGKSAIRWVYSHATVFGIDKGQIVAGGGSAGGHIAASTAVLSGFNEADEDTSVSCVPKALVLFNPVLNNGPDGYGYERVGDFYKQFSPHHNLHINTPPTLIMVGTEDKLFTPPMAKAYKKKMENMGLRCDLIFYQGYGHAFFNKGQSEEMYYQTMIDVDRFLISLGYLAGEPSTLQSFREVHFKKKDNPFVKHIYSADPSAHVFNDKMYVYTSHDEDTASYFNMIDWHVFSTENMVDWTDHGAVFSLDDINWADKWAWAPDCVERDGKYYFYYPVERAKIGVAVSDSPIGPFKDVLGKPLIDNTGQVEHIGKEPIDPSVLIEKGQAYMYFGCREPKVVKLKKNMMALKGDVQELKIKGIEGDNEHFGGFYGEAPWVFKRKDTYYLLYSNGWGKTSTLVYATSKKPMGPFNFQGEVMDVVSSWTSHGSIVQFKDKWYVFYHNMDLSNNNYRRSICFDELTFDENGRINKLKL